MAYKCIILIALIGFIAATPLEYHHESGHHFIEEHEHHHEAPQPYDFSYGVHDEHTGDVKDQHESSDGHNVHGSYSLIDADGYKRTVTYSADPHKGFEAEVHRVPLHGHGHGGHIVSDHHSFDGHHF